MPGRAAPARSRAAATALEARILLAIFAGGCAGTLLRVALAEAVPPHAGRWPWATFVVNVAGAGLLGWAATHWPPQRRRRSLVGTGFCGALTTFSALQLELLHLLDAGRTGVAVAYAVASILAGLVAAWAGTRLGRRRPGRAR
jgi:CrcB protein